MVFQVCSFCRTFAAETLAIVKYIGIRSMVTKEIEQGQQYKEYTREATGYNAERSVQLLGGELWYN